MDSTHHPSHQAKHARQMAPAAKKAAPAANKTAAEVVKAVDLAPKAFGAAAHAASGGDALKDKPDDLQYDLRHLTALDSHPVDLEKFQADPEGYLRDVATFAVQGIVARWVVDTIVARRARGMRVLVIHLSIQCVH